jgi:hypothetical protein
MMWWKIGMAHDIYGAYGGVIWAYISMISHHRVDIWAS